MTPYFYLVDHMEASGYTKDEASYVLSGIGVANTIGMVTKPQPLRSQPIEIYRWGLAGPVTNHGPTLVKYMESV